MLKFFFSLDRIEDVMLRYIDLPPDKRFRYDINRLVYFITSLPNLVVINTILYNNLKKRKKKNYIITIVIVMVVLLSFMKLEMH